jgi:hypothetical protein
MAALAPEQVQYGFEYLNRQSPLSLSLSATNNRLDYDELEAPAGWDSLYLVTTADVVSAGIGIPFPSPAHVSLGLGLRATSYFWKHRLAGAPAGKDFELQEGWSRRRQQTDLQIFFGARFLEPYAYALVHPLRLFEGEVGAVSKTYGLGFFYYARATFPIGGEWTLTGRWQGERLDYNVHVDDARLPDGQDAIYLWGGRRGFIQDGYAGVDFPLHKGYMGELPLLGLWNYLGAGVFGSYYGREYDRQDADRRYLVSRSVREEIVAGAKLTGLFHIMRRVPLALSFQGGYDLNHDSPVFRFRTELAGIPSTVSLRPRFDPGLGEARRRGL